MFEKNKGFNPFVKVDSTHKGKVKGKLMGISTWINFLFRKVK